MTPAPERLADADLIRRLRGEYRIPITDGMGPAGGEEPDNPNEFVRRYETSPIMHEAAACIERLSAQVAELESDVAELDALDAEAKIGAEEAQRQLTEATQRAEVVAAEAIERAAKVCDERAAYCNRAEADKRGGNPAEYWDGACNSAELLAMKLRSLPSPPTPEA